MDILIVIHLKNNSTKTDFSRIVKRNIKHDLIISSNTCMRPVMVLRLFLWNRLKWMNIYCVLSYVYKNLFALGGLKDD